MIRRLAEKIANGTKFFVGHGDTNSHEGRESVGEVIASFVKEIGGRLSHVIVGHFPNTEKVAKMDVCSMEADIYTDDDNIVGDINNISGIALASGDKENPAFPGALRLGTVQCFDKPNETYDLNKGDRRKQNMETLTFEQVKTAVRQMNIHPWQLFTLDDLKNDRNFNEIFVENEKLKGENVKLKETSDKVEKESKEAVRTMTVGKAGEALNKLMEEGYTDKQKKFIVGRFKPETMEKLEESDLTKFIEGAKKEFADTAKLFGASTEKVTKDGNGKSKENQEAETPEDEALKLMGVND